MRHRERATGACSLDMFIRAIQPGAGCVCVNRLLFDISSRLTNKAMSETYPNTVETMILYFCTIVPIWEPEPSISTVIWRAFIVIAMEVLLVCFERETFAKFKYGLSQLADHTSINQQNCI